MPCWFPRHFLWYTYMETKHFFDHCVHFGEFQIQNTLWKTNDGEHCSLNSEQSKSCFDFGQKNMGALRHGALKAFRALWANIETIFVKKKAMQLSPTLPKTPKKYWKTILKIMMNTLLLVHNSLDENIYKPLRIYLIFCKYISSLATTYPLRLQIPL